MPQSSHCGELRRKSLPVRRRDVVKSNAPSRHHHFAACHAMQKSGVMDCISGVLDRQSRHGASWFERDLKTDCMSIWLTARQSGDSRVRVNVLDTNRRTMLPYNLHGTEGGPASAVMCYTSSNKTEICVCPKIRSKKAVRPVWRKQTATCYRRVRGNSARRMTINHIVMFVID